MNAQRKLRYKEKMSHLEAYSNNLSRWVEDYSRESGTQTIVKTKFALYHMGVLCVEVMTDLAAMILNDLKHSPTDDYTNFKKLKDLNIITQDLEKQLSEANGLRTRLAHDYNGIDEELAIAALEQLKETTVAYRGVIEKWLLQV